MSEKQQVDSPELIDLRKRIDACDQQILRLIQERVLVAADIAKAKLAVDENASFYRPEREAQVLRRVRERNIVLREELNGLVADDEMVRLMREIMSISLAAEMPMSVAYLGPEGTYTQAAVIKHFGQAVNSLDVKTIADVFRVVEQGKAHFGVVPVENSTEGVITHTLDCFSTSNLKVCGEVQLPISHQLLSHADGLTAVEKVYAHPQALAQRIESRPSRQTNWEYVFFIDLIGHVDEPRVASALKELQSRSAYFKLIGSYPVGVL